MTFLNKFRYVKIESRKKYSENYSKQNFDFNFYGIKFFL